jgi:hypothetical protein
MFSGITGKLVIIQFCVILTLIGTGYAYFRYSESVIAGLHEDKAKLETAVKTQEETIAAQKQAAQKQNAENLRLQQGLFDAENQRRDLEAKLRRKNLEAMARANSADLEQRINRATSQAFKDIETLTKPKDRTEPTLDAQPKPREQKDIPTAQSNSTPSNIQPPPRAHRSQAGGPK